MCVRVCVGGAVVILELTQLHAACLTAGLSVRERVQAGVENNDWGFCRVMMDCACNTSLGEQQGLEFEREKIVEDDEERGAHIWGFFNDVLNEDQGVLPAMTCKYYI